MTAELTLHLVSLPLDQQPARPMADVHALKTDTYEKLLPSILETLELSQLTTGESIVQHRQSVVQSVRDLSNLHRSTLPETMLQVDQSAERDVCHSKADCTEPTWR